MDQAAMFNVKSNYVRTTLKGIAKAVQMSDVTPYYVLKGFSSISAARSELSESCMNSVCRKLGLYCIYSRQRSYSYSWRKGGFEIPVVTQTGCRIIV
jgi:hypothetical protein